MTSIYRRALGDEFDDLHPEIRRHYGLQSGDGIAFVGRGEMEEVRRGSWYTVPALAIGTRRNLLFPEHGSNVSFVLRNYAYRDTFDREAVSWLREFRLPTTRRFDAVMVYSEGRGAVIDYLGTHGDLATDLHLTVMENGGIHIQSTAMRVFAGPVRVPLPQVLSGTADVQEWYDEDEDRFRVSVSVRNPLMGELFGYSGWFELEEKPIEEIPPEGKPVREEKRE